MGGNAQKGVEGERAGRGAPREKGGAWGMRTDDLVTPRPSRVQEISKKACGAYMMHGEGTGCTGAAALSRRVRERGALRLGRDELLALFPALVDVDEVQKDRAERAAGEARAGGEDDKLGRAGEGVGDGTYRMNRKTKG